MALMALTVARSSDDYYVNLSNYQLPAGRVSSPVLQ